MGLVLVWTPLYGRDHLHLMPGPANLIQDGNWSLGSVLGQTSNASQPAPSHCYQVTYTTIPEHGYGLWSVEKHTGLNPQERRKRRPQEGDRPVRAAPRPGPARRRRAVTGPPRRRRVGLLRVPRGPRTGLVHTQCTPRPPPAPRAACRVPPHGQARGRYAPPSPPPPRRRCSAWTGKSLRTGACGVYFSMQHAISLHHVRRKRPQHRSSLLSCVLRVRQYNVRAKTNVLRVQPQGAASTARESAKTLCVGLSVYMSVEIIISRGTLCRGELVKARAAVERTNFDALGEAFPDCEFWRQSRGFKGACKGAYGCTCSPTHVSGAPAAPAVRADQNRPWANRVAA